MSADWGPVIVAVVLFILLSPGLLFQLPSRTRVIEFGNMCTSGIAILVHAILNSDTNSKTLTDRDVPPGSAGVDMEMDSQDQNSIDGKEKKSVDSNGLAISFHASKLQLLAVPWKRKQKSWR
ncbi:Protein of unknown function DUF3339 - like 4 [Theobroma cacao]|nr:Protein of unknown function DUF3339 - like 4 [Theobroma cacao]